AGIAYFAHLGGGLFGYLYLKSEWLRRQASYWSAFSLTGWRRKRKTAKEESRREDLQRQVDRILDKVSRHGMDSLSGKERKALELKSKRQK
ncbi:MAG: rhomboid family intramembrane serine protease, partial [Candidatus Omnitrophica bacterium]|nr:rhomboid family intramembrane serine protease [Candidatus Omnitrophota bacterium]